MQGDWFKSRMKQLGLDEEAVGKRLRLDRSVVNRIFNGVQPVKLREIEPLADILQVSALEVIARVFSWTDQEAAPLFSTWLRVPKERRPQALRHVELLIEGAPPSPTPIDPHPAAAPLKKGRSSSTFAAKTLRRRSVK